MLTCGSAFSGAGLLDLGLSFAGIHHLWLCEKDEERRGILADRWPDARVLDDVRHLGHGLPHVELFAGGFPCKGASTAGKRNGFEHPETVLWREMFRAIRELRPRYVLVENVANILSLHRGAIWAEVLRDLASIGMDVVWDCLPAASVGATHLRDRVFAVATYPDGSDGQRDAGLRVISDGRADARGSDQDAPDASGSGREGEGRRRPVEPDERPLGADVEGRAQVVADAGDGRQPQHAQRHGEQRQGIDRQFGDDPLGRGVAVEWGAYEPAIRRWEAVHGPAPKPLVRRVDDGNAKVQRVRARVDRSRLSALGDGVQVQIGFIAGAYIVELERRRLADAV